MNTRDGIELDAAARARGRLVAVRVVMRAIRDVRKLREEFAVARSQPGHAQTLNLSTHFQRLDQGLETWLGCGGILPEPAAPPEAESDPN